MTPLAWVAVGLLGGLAAAARFAIDAEIAARAQSAFPSRSGSSPARPCMGRR
jgi:hypothetical protein